MNKPKQLDLRLTRIDIAVVEGPIGRPDPGHVDDQQPKRTTAGVSAPWWLLALSIACPSWTEHGHDRALLDAARVHKDEAIEVAKINRDATIQAAKIANPPPEPKRHHGKERHKP